MNSERPSKIRRPRRLADFNYRGEYVYFVTICTNWKQIIFTNLDIYNSNLAILRDVAANQKMLLHAWCFMPDHLHLLNQGSYDSTSLIPFIKLFKQKSGYYYKKTNNNRLWQEGYYEYVLRKNEDIKEKVLYILQNPVRKGLVKHYSHYQYLGSDTFDIRLL